MQLKQLWSPNLRIIEVDAADGTLGSTLHAAGYRNYLAITRDDRRRDAIAKRHPAIARCIVTSNFRRVVRQNNAEVLILNSWSSFALARFRSVRHAEFIAIRLQPTPLCWLAILLAMIQWLAGRVSRPTLQRLSPSQVNANGESKQSAELLVFRVRRRRRHNGVRRFIPHSRGIKGFLECLEATGMRYAVLRWFDELPNLPPGEDVDLLVDDKCLESVRALLDEGPGIQPVDVYSVSGLPGADFRSMPYFPPYLAEELLDRAVVHRGLCRVPARREHFLSLAYHALYHKGTASGLPTGWRKTRTRKCDHDYTAVLRQLALQLNIDVEMTLEGLDAALDAQGWRPPHDMLVRLARHNPWVRSLLHRPHGASPGHGSMAVFLIREEALLRGGIERAARLIESHGFRILAKHIIDSTASGHVARTIRGGNWGRGPWPISGGPPVAAIVVYDPSPIQPNRRQRRRFPFVANARLLCKEKIRDEFNAGFPADQHCNVIHSSDNGREALDYLRIIMPDEADGLLRRIGSGAKEVVRAA